MDFHCLRLVNFVQFFRDPTKNNNESKDKSNNEEKGAQTLHNISCKSRVCEESAEKNIQMENRIQIKTENKKVAHDITETQNYATQKLNKSGIKSVTIVCNQTANKRTTQIAPIRYKKPHFNNNLYLQSDNSIDSRRRCRTLSLSSVKKSLSLKHFLSKRWSGKTDLTKSNQNKRRNKRIETLFATSRSLNNSSSSSNKLFDTRGKIIRRNDRSTINSNDSLIRKVTKNFPWVKRTSICFVVNNRNRRGNRHISNHDSNDRCALRVIDLPLKNEKRCSSKKTNFDVEPDNDVQKDVRIRKQHSDQSLKKMPHEEGYKQVYSARIVKNQQKERSSKQSLRSCLRQTPHYTTMRDSCLNYSIENIEICKNKTSTRYDNNISSESGGDTATARVNDSLTNSFPWSGRENYYFESTMLSYDRPQTSRESHEDYGQRMRTDHRYEYSYPKYSPNTPQKMQMVSSDVSTQIKSELFAQSNTLIENKYNAFDNTNNSKDIADIAMCTCDNIIQAKSGNTTNQQITKHEEKGFCVDKVFDSNSKGLLQHGVLANRTHSRKVKCHSNENVQNEFCNVSKYLSEVKSGLPFSNSPHSGRSTLKQILFYIVTLAWSPCILMANFRRCLTKPFHSKHQKNTRNKKSDRLNDNSMHRSSILSNYSKNIKKNDSLAKRSERNIPKDTKTYTLHHISDKGWVLKPNRPKRIRRRRSNFGSIFQTFNYKKVSKPILRNNMSYASNDCGPSQYKKTSGSSSKFPLWKPLSKKSVRQNKNSVMPIKNKDDSCREIPSKVSFLSSSQSVEISERGSRPRMRHTKVVPLYRGDRNEMKHDDARSRSEPKRIPSVSRLTQTRIKQTDKKTEITIPSKSRLDCGDQAKNQSKASSKASKGQPEKIDTNHKESVFCECVKADSCECYPKLPRRDKNGSCSSNHSPNDDKSKDKFESNNCNMTSNNLKYKKSDQFINKRGECQVTEINSNREKNYNEKSVIKKSKSDPNEDNNNFKKSRKTIQCNQSSHKHSIQSKHTSSVSEISRNYNMSQENANLKKAKGDIKFDQSLHKKSHLSLCSSDICKDLKRHSKENKKSVIILSESRNKTIFKRIRALLKKSGASIHFTSSNTGSKLRKSSSSSSFKIDISKSSTKIPKHDQSKTTAKKYQSDRRGSSFSLKAGCSEIDKHNQSLQCVIMPKASKRDKATEYKIRKSDIKRFGSMPFCRKIICRKRKSHNYSNDSPSNKKSRRIFFRTKYKPETCLNVTVPQNIRNSKYSQYSVSCSNLLPIGVTLSTQPTKSTVPKHICTTMKKIKCNCARKCHRRRRNAFRSKGTQKNSTSVICLPIPKNKSLLVMDCRTHRSQQCSTSLLSCADCLQPRWKHYCPKPYTPCQKPYPPCPPFPPCPKPFPPCSKSYSSCKHYPPCLKSSSCEKPHSSCQKLYPPCHKSYSPYKKSNSPCKRYTPVIKSYRDCTTICPDTCPRWRWYHYCRRQYPYVRPCQSFRKAPCRYCKKKKRCWCNLKKNARNLGWLLISPFTCVYNILYRADYYGWEDHQLSPCNNIRLNSLRSKPYFHWFEGCPDLYLEFWACHKKCQDCGRCCLMCLAGCIWVPCIAFCYYLCKGLCRICTL